MIIETELELATIDRCGSCKLQSVLTRLRENQCEERYMRARAERMSAEIEEFLQQVSKSI